MTTDLTVVQLNTLTAVEYAARLNEETRAWLAEDAGRGAGLLVEDQDFWAERGILSGLHLARYLAASTFSDMYKEKHGVRPRWVNFEDKSLAEIEAMIEAI